MKSLIGNLLFLAALLLIIARFFTVGTGVAFPLDIVSANSMAPTLMEGDIVAWTPTRIEDLKIGDVVVFKSYIKWPDEKLVIHRVHNIKIENTTGRPILETKGDANEWIDQEGPHIPEPYIREDHVMGKAISIGQQPLKIPFIGMIGIWINQGLEQLAEPTSTKGSLSFIGVFAPLTLSAVILVVLFFLLPEKAKTLKEKLRFFIFGPKQLNIKKTLMFFLIIYLLFLMFIHCFAFDSISASVGIDADSPNSSTNFGRITQGTTSFSRGVPVINPSIMPVKGIVFGRGSINEYITREIFELEPGKSAAISLQAVAPNGSQNGSYLGEIMIYSSPFWILFPDDFISDLCAWNPEATVYLLDLLTALFLTFLTVTLLTVITFISEESMIWATERSWRHTSTPILKKRTIERTTKIKRKIRWALGKRIGWIARINLAESETGEHPVKSFVKPVLASLVIIPVVLLITDQIMAMIIASLIAGLVVYFISCKMRKKIILTAVLVMSMAIAYMVIHANMLLIAKDYTLIELMALVMGAIGVYLLVLAFLLIPISLLSWFLACLIRNLKEQKDPLLILEGKCDL